MAVMYRIPVVRLVRSAMQPRKGTSWISAMENLNYSRSLQLSAPFCNRQGSSSTSARFDRAFDRTASEGRQWIRTPSRAMSSLVPEQWRNFVTKFMETKMVKEEFARHYINKDLGYGEFNKFGTVNPWCITDYFEGSLNLFNQDMTGLEHVSLFARNTEMNFRRGMETSLHPDQALKFKVWLSYLGKSSVCWDAQCLDASTGEELASYAIQMVTVDMKMRRPGHFAHILKDQCPQNLREHPPRGFDVEFKPENAFKHRFTVNWSDTDFNSHLNQADITRMCIDCGSFAATKNALSAFTRELAFYNLKRSSIMFMREARPGDEVLVKCWEGEESPLVLNYAFSKKGDLITLLQLEYYEGDGAL